MADEKQTKEIVVKPGDTDSTRPVTVTQAELDHWFDLVFGRIPRTEKEDR